MAQTFHFRLRSAARIPVVLAVALAGACGLASADTVLSAGTEKKVEVWSVPDGALVKSIDAADGAVTAMALSPDGKTIATGGTDSKVKLWSYPDGQLARTIDLPAGGTVALRFVDGGKRLISGASDNKAYIWEVATGKQIGSMTLTGPAVGIFFAQGMIVIGADNKIYLFDTDGHSAPPGEIPTDHSAGLKAIAGSPTEPMLFTGGGDGKIKYWSFGDTGEFNGSQPSAVTAMVVSPDGKRLIVGGANGDVTIWDTDARKMLKTIKAAHTGKVTAVAVSPDGRLILTGGADHLGKVWSIAGDPIKSQDTNDGEVTAILYHADTPAAAAPK